MDKKSKKALIITVIVVAVLAISGTVAIAASNISDIEELYLAFRTAQVEASVNSGDMTADEAEDYLSGLNERLEEDESDAVPPLKGGDRSSAQRGSGGMKGAAGMNAADIYAEISGQSADEIMEACKDGETTVYAMADEAGMLDELKAAMIEDSNARIDEQLSEGNITEEQAAQMKEKAEETISAITADSQGMMRGMGQRSQGGRGEKPGGCKDEEPAAAEEA